MVDIFVSHNCKPAWLHMAAFWDRMHTERDSTEYDHTAFLQVMIWRGNAILTEVNKLLVGQTFTVQKWGRGDLLNTNNKVIMKNAM